MLAMLVIFITLLGGYLFVAPLIALIKISSLNSEIIKLKNQVDWLSREMKTRAKQKVVHENVAAHESVSPPITAEPSNEDKIVKASIFKPSDEEKIDNTPIFKPLQDEAPSFKVKEVKTQDLQAWPNFIVNSLSFIKKHWIYIIAGISLALSGVFLVQYSIENSLLSPTARLMLGLTLGILLTYSGEYIRKRWGDGEDSVTAFLPSIFSSAGIITLFSVVLAARHLYDIIGPNITFIGLLAISALAVFLGWISSALLAVLGISGAFITPLILGSSGDATPLTVYYLMITLAGLLIDHFRKWKWFSAVVVASSLAVFILLSSTWGDVWSTLYALTLISLTILVLTWQVQPKDQETPLLLLLKEGSSVIVSDQTAKILIHSVIAVTVGVLALWCLGQVTLDRGLPWHFLLTFLGLSIALIVWLKNASSLEDVAVWPTIALGLVFVSILMNVPDNYVELSRQFQDNATPMRSPSLWQSDAIKLIGISVLLSLTFTWRLLQNGQFSRVYALLSMFVPPLSFVLIDIIWEPTQYLGEFSWAMVAMVLALLIGAYIERFVRRSTFLVAIEDGLDKLAISIGLIAISGLINYALLILLSPQALTIALAATVLVIMVVDYKFDLPLLSHFAILGILAVSFRLVAYPGVFWAQQATFSHMLFVFGSSLGLLIYGWIMYLDEKRYSLRVILESAAVSLLAIFVMLIVYHIFKWLALDLAAIEEFMSAITLLILSAVQAWRLQQEGRMYAIRLLMMVVFAISAALWLFHAWTECSPLWSNRCHSLNYAQKPEIHGFILLNTNLIMFAFPALFAGFVARQFTHLPVYFRLYYLGISAVMGITWLIHENAFIWRGMSPQDISMPQAELYMYTIELLLAGAFALYYSVKTGSQTVRKVGLSLIGLTIAKVFFIDAAGLEGLMRAVSFLVLGLSLAGLAWVSRLLQR